jgi:hypothetical protein
MEDVATLLADFHDLWTPWERSFFETVNRTGKCSPKQQAVLDTLRVRAEMFAFAKAHGWQP